MVANENKTRKATTPGEKIEKMSQPPATPEAFELIGHRLRNYYDEVTKQTVPDRFLDLLNALEAASGAKKSN